MKSTITMDQQTNIHLNEAEELLHKASEEMCKPEEDVVPYGVCRNSYYAVINFMISFLENHGEIVSESSSVKDLLNRCRTIDPRFNDLHLTPMFDPTKSEDVWMNMDAARDYLKMAKNTQEIIVQ